MGIYFTRDSSGSTPGDSSLYNHQTVRQMHMKQPRMAINNPVPNDCSLTSTGHANNGASYVLTRDSGRDQERSKGDTKDWENTTDDEKCRDESDEQGDDEGWNA